MRPQARLRAALLESRHRPAVAGAAAPRPHRSDGYEFAELREYVPGDDPRRIDWAATARAGALQTRLMYEDHALVLAAALDATASMFVGRSRSLYDDARAALATWYGLAWDDDHCLRVCGDSVVGDVHRRGRSAAHLCASVCDEPGAPFPTTLEVALATVPRDAALLVISDFYDLGDLWPLLRRLASRCDVTALVARDPWHDAFPLGGFVRLRDAESGATQRLFVGRLERTRFHEAVVARETEIHTALESVGIRVGVLARDAERALAEAFAIA